MASVFKNQVVTFTVNQSDDGNLQAKSLAFADAPLESWLPARLPWELAAPGRGPRIGTQPSMVSEGQGMQGTVVSFNSAKGFGFITCANVIGDVYFKDHTGRFAEGAPISFHLKIMPDGKPQAQGVSPGFAAQESHSGTISSYSARHGWGFIAVRDYPAEVYFKKESIVSSDFGEELKGTSVRVTIKLTDDGLPQASSVELLGVARPSRPGTKREAATSGPIQPLTQFPKRMKGPDGGAPQAIRGTVLSYNPVKGFGFIQSPEVQGDVFLGRNALQISGAPADASLQGRHISFQLVTSPQGKLQAENIQVVVQDV